MGYRSFSRESFSGTAERVKRAGGDTSYAGRQVIKETGKLHALVDPAGYGLIRKSLPRYVQLPSGQFHNIAGIPMSVETVFDTTGSMGRNVQLAFESLPKLYDLLTTGKQPVLGRYDVQIANGIFGDVVDNFIASRTQFEMAEKIAEQLTLMVPENGGGDGPEDPEYNLFASAYLTAAHIREYGLKGYHFMVTDATSHGGIDDKNLVRVFGDEVYIKAAENGQQISKKKLPDTADIVRALKDYSHAFAVVVGNRAAARYWAGYYGNENVVFIQDTSILPYVESAIIGLTEGIISLSEIEDYLQEVGVSARDAREIADAVAVIPIAAQQAYPNFTKIPPKGMVYANKGDLWPVAVHASSNEIENLEEGKWL